jgi:hypothetical protein
VLDLEVAGRVRDLEPEETEAVAAPVVIKRLRESHHTVAKLLVHGLTPLAVSLQTGYSVSRISALQRDESFRELLRAYRNEEEVRRSDFMDRMLGYAEDFAQESHDRLLDDPTSFSHAEVHDHAKLYIDRSGFAPVQRSLTKSVVMNIGDRMDAAHKRLRDLDDPNPNQHLTDPKLKPNPYQRDGEGE